VKTASILLGLTGVVGAALAQDASPSQDSSKSDSTSKPSRAKREVTHRLELIATRAIANFRSAESIEKNLKSLGASLHPQLVSLRLRIEAALDRAEDAIKEDDLPAATEALDQAQALLDRYAAKLGGS
jgi:hypothetical protein